MVDSRQVVAADHERSDRAVTSGDDMHRAIATSLPVLWFAIVEGSSADDRFTPEFSGALLMSL